MSSGKIYVLEDVEVDTGRVVVRRAGAERSLRPKTFRLLLYLIEHRNRLVPKEELIEQLWPDTAVSDGAVAQCVTDIRRALGEDPRNPKFIRTAARLGYQFIGYVEEAPSHTVTVEEITEARVEYSEEVVEDEPAPLQAGPASWLPSPGLWGWRRIALLFALTILGLTAAVAAWQYWKRSSGSREPEWWEVAWWKLNEGNGSTIADSIHGLTATLPSGVSWTPGISGSALLFTGRELVVRGNDPGWALPVGTTPRTLTAWIKTSSTNGDSTPILVEGDVSPDSFSTFFLGLAESGTAAFGNGHFPLNGKERIDDDRWHQVTGVFEGAESQRMRLFVDGVEQTSMQAQDPPGASKVSAWTIGTGLAGGTTFRGAVDDVRIYERALRSDEIQGLYRCMVGADDIDVEGGGSYYFAPIFGDHVEILSRRPGDQSAGVRNTGKDLGGIMFVRREADCALRSIHGANIGQDLNIEAELLVPAGSAGAVTDAGLYFRSRSADPGDGIVGGTSAGFWVRLDSTGQVRVQRLYPNAVLGFSSAPEHFDPGLFHKLEAAVHGETLEVALDGRPLTFDAGGVPQAVLQIPPVWERALPRGSNGGSVGIAFGCTRNRKQAGGQEARDIRVKPYQPFYR